MYNADTPKRSELPSPGKLLRSTFLAAVSAGVILIAIVLPSEYGIDPTGAGRALGLKDMGETKIRLAAEAAADHAAAENNMSASDPVPAPAPGPDMSGLYKRIDALELAVRGLTMALQANQATDVQPAPAQDAAATAPEPEPLTEQRKQHQATFTLDPGAGIEIKLVMKKGARADFAWASEGGPVNFDTHGDGPGDQAISYEKGRGVASDEGSIIAEFDGNHGWFWRNRGKQPVTLSLRTAGDYSDIKGLPN